MQPLIYGTELDSFIIQLLHMIQANSTNVSIKQPARTENNQEFLIEAFQRTPLLQVSPFKHTDDLNFAIMFYRPANRDLSDPDLPLADGCGHLIFKSPGQTGITCNKWELISGYCIQFSESFLLQHRLLLGILTNFPFFEISLLKNNPLQITAAESDTLSDLYKRVYAEFQYAATDPNFDLIIAYLQALLLTIKRIYVAHTAEIEDKEAEQQNKPGDIVRKFKSLVWLDTVIVTEKGVSRKPVSAYASMLFIHPNYLNALVKKETGKTAREYIDEQLFKIAIRLLSNEQLLIKEIAWRLSFNETAHFNNFFKRLAGVSPGVFRKQNIVKAA